MIKSESHHKFIHIFGKYLFKYRITHKGYASCNDDNLKKIIERLHWLSLRSQYYLKTPIMGYMQNTNDKKNTFKFKSV